MTLITTGQENLKFVKLCFANQVEFLLMGGAAVSFYGCREADGFDDIDLMPGPSRENSERLMSALKQADVRINNFTVDELQQPNKRITLKPPSYNYNLDILTPRAEWSYADFQDRSEITMLVSVEMRVLSKADLIITKEWVVKFLESEAAKAPAKAEMLQVQAEKHRRDLICLRSESK